MTVEHPVLARLAAAGHEVRIDVQPYKGAGARSYRRGWFSCEVRVTPPLPRLSSPKMQMPGWNASTSQRFVVQEPTAHGARNEALTRLEMAVNFLVDEHMGAAMDADVDAKCARERAGSARAIATKYRRPE